MPCPVCPLCFLGFTMSWGACPHLFHESRHRDLRHFPVGLAITGKFIRIGPLPFWSQVGVKRGSKKEPQKQTPSGSSSWAPLGAFGGHLGPKHVKKGAKRKTKEGSKTELNRGPQKKHEKVSSTHYLQCFSKVERSKKNNFLC